MASFTNNYNNTFTDTNIDTDTEQSNENSFINKIKERIILKKLDRFQFVDFNNLPPKLPVLKPTLNSIEINAALEVIQTNELILGKSTLSSRVMIYMDCDGIAWEVAVNNFNNEIIDVEYCGSRQSDNSQATNIVNLPNHNEIYWSGPNIFNKKNSKEYKMIISVVLKGIISDSTIYLDNEQIEQTLKNLSYVDPWKVLNIKSIPTDSHIFATKIPNGNIWIVVTNWSLDDVICSYQLV